MGIAACKKQVDPPSFNYDYYDLTFGRFIEYDVLEINHDVDQTVQHDTLRYQLKTVIGDTVIDNEGRIARKFIRYKRSNSNSNWAQTDLWTTIIDQNRAELVEENQRVIKMIFVPNFTTKTGGMGLGLAMVKSILENINSNISFTSIENEGTIFELRFPIAI